MFKNAFTTESILRAVFGTVCFVLILWYALFQSRHLIDGPKIILIEEPSITHTEKIIQITGKTENITHISMNGREIYTDEDGAFKEPLVLEDGYTIMTITAEDRYGRSTSLSRSFVYQTNTTN